MPKISVIMPSLNVQSYIKQCIESVISQTLSDIEIICVDAGSTDGTLEILQEYALKDSRIIIVNSSVRSYGAQVNIGIKKAKADYIAIVETDDYIAPNMYETLYRIVEKYNNLDYVKADWKSVIAYNEKEFIFEKHLQPEQSGIYNKEICVSDYPQLYLCDVTVWRGIYRKKFLIDNKIWFNETQGAAFQDYGFSIMVNSYASKAYYLRDGLYFYRDERIGSSSVNKNAVRFVWQEWNRLLGMGFFNRKHINGLYIYLRIAMAFWGEYRKVLLMVDFDTESEYLKPYYDLIAPHIKELIQTGQLIKADNSLYWWDELLMILNMPSEYTLYLKDKINAQKEAECKLKKFVNGRKVVIFGCGAYGSKVFTLMLRLEIEVVAFCDNDIKKHRTFEKGVPVYSVKQAIEKYSQAVYLVANKYYSDEMMQQLQTFGVECKNIINIERGIDNDFTGYN